MSQPSSTQDQTAVAPAQAAQGLPKSIHWTDAIVRQFSSVLTKKIRLARRTEAATGVKGLLGGVRCNDFIIVPVPTVEESTPVLLDSVRPQVWFTTETGATWSTMPETVGWQRTIVRELNGVILTRTYAVYTETTSVGQVNSPVYRATMGQPCFGNVLVVRVVGEADTHVDDIEDADIALVREMFHCMLRDGQIVQTPAKFA